MATVDRAHILYVYKGIVIVRVLGPEAVSIERIGSHLRWTGADDKLTRAAAATPAGFSAATPACRLAAGPPPATLLPPLGPSPAPPSARSTGRPGAGHSTLQPPTKPGAMDDAARLAGAGVAAAAAAPPAGAAVMGVFKYNFAAQFLSRAIPFVFNIWFVRQLGADDGAVSAFALQLPLFMNCILFLSREGFRRACLRNDSQSDVLTDEAILKVAWMVVPFAIVITSIGSLFVLRVKKLKLSDPYAKAILIIGFACILELLAEPLYIISQKKKYYNIRVYAEPAATLFRCLTTFILVKGRIKVHKLVLVSLSQVVYGAFIFFGYLSYFLLFTDMKISDLLPIRFDFSRVQFHLLIDAKLLSGSLVVRIVFLPFEESSYTTFARLAGETPQNISNLEGSLLGALKLIMLIGTSEAFLHAVANENQLKQSNDMLLLFSGSFSFRRCVPAGWGILLISGLTTVFSERVFLDRKRFKQTVPIHIAIGIMCLSISSFEIYRGEKQFLRQIFGTLKLHDKSQ
ncbi:hypothetical protein C2845_PM04G24770 [Panicum miliaceum]|uniref:Protein RFT1 homolog n=1 Tax=Panicum miliaceum TaxID=4540 RepID=A0A3L6QSR7_PANMI|nr:hypothetical protein C2845_PM04G24770 [Panicum miliaceum]